MLWRGFQRPKRLEFERETLTERFDRFDEGLEVITSLLQNRTTNFAGRYYQLTDALCEPKPVQAHMPIWVGGGGEKRTLKIAAKYADAWNVPFISPDLATANVAPGKSGYLVNTVNQGVQVLAQANTCNNVANSFTDFLGTATPITVGTTGQRSFGSDARGKPTLANELFTEEAAGANSSGDGSA